MKYTYFVSYQHKSAKGFGFGNFAINRTSKITSWNDIQGIKKFICDAEGIDNAIILNYQLLKKKVVVTVNLQQAWHEFIIALAEETGIARVLRWLVSKF